MEIAICSYDGTSREPGSAHGARVLWERYFSALGRASTEIKTDSKNSSIWCRKLRAVVNRHDIRLAIGGEHLITFPLLEARKERCKDLKLVVMDAHHDSYDYPLLTHYSLFWYTQYELRIPTLIVGARFELEQAARDCQILPAEAIATLGVVKTAEEIRRFVDGSPFYFSLDLDVIDPEVFRAVGAPVSGGLSIETCSSVVKEVLSLAPVAADVTEYNALCDDEARTSLGHIGPVMEEYRRWMGRCV